MLSDLLRSLPYMLAVVEFINGLAENNRESLFLSLGLLVGNNFNMVLKYIIKEIFGINSITSRPEGARNCGIFNDCSLKICSSSGMPSGHTQAIAFWAGFKLKKIFLKEKNWKNRKLSIIGIFIISILTGLGRLSGKYVGSISTYYDAGCHTPLQVIVGYILGFYMGWKYYDFVNKKLL